MAGGGGGAALCVFSFCGAIGCEPLFVEEEEDGRAGGSAGHGLGSSQPRRAAPCRVLEGQSALVLNASVPNGANSKPRVFG